MHDYERALKYMQGTTKFEPVYAVIDAVKKQIAQPVVFKNKIPHCSSCDQPINAELNIKYNLKHCPYCGQAIKNKE